MLILYFSGTGNSRFIARQLARITEAKVHSIEEKLDFATLLGNDQRIAFVYPIYGSCVPLVMRQFVRQHKEYLAGKEIIILCTQALFSGDGARVLTELLGEISYTVIYAEHFRMPSNIPNFPLFPMASPERTKVFADRATARLQEIGEHLRQGIIFKRGFSSFSKYLGFVAQRSYFARIEKKLGRDVRIASTCVRCQKCVRLCPMANLELDADNAIKQKGNCTLCYRCVNQCPRQAITVMTHGRVTRQYEWQDQERN